MTEHDDERIVSRRYRELPREEPPSRLDDAIRARARAARETLPAPLVAPTGRRRWYFPVAAAAILVLAVAVTWQVEREQSDAYVASAPEPVAQAKEAPPAPAAPAASAAREDAAQPQLGAAARSEVMAKRALAETPEQALERIAKLRAEGRHEEADRALAEFRKRHPEFRIPAEMRERVERR